MIGRRRRRRALPFGRNQTRRCSHRAR
jgi:hypothetical protein